MFGSRKLRLALGLLLVLGAGAACSDSNEPGSEDATFRLVNNSGTTVDAVYFSNCDNPSWGDDRLGATETVATGTTRNFAITNGCWDFRVDYLDASIDTDLDVTVDGGETYIWTLTAITTANATLDRGSVKVK